MKVTIQFIHSLQLCKQEEKALAPPLSNFFHRIALGKGQISVQTGGILMDPGVRGDKEE